MRSSAIAYVSILLASTALVSVQAHAAVDCAALPQVVTGLGVSNTTIDVAEAIPAGSYTPSGSRPITGLPAFCHVHGVVTPVAGSRVGFEVWLPQSGWNSKLEMFGNGGYSSALDYTDMAAQLIRGYATLGTDTGHNGSDPNFAQGNPASIVDWSWRAVHVSIVASKEIAAAFYGTRPVHNYFSGCSTGGQQAFSEVQRFPADFDGVIAGDPGHNRTHLNAGFLWEYLKDHPYRQDNAPILPASKLPMVTAAVLNACRVQNPLNGGLQTDAFLADPRDCHFDPKALLCQGADQPSCLTAAQVQTVQSIYDGPSDPRTGHLIENGYTRGSEAATPPGWASYFQDFNGLNEPARTNFWKIWVFNDPNWDWWTFDFDRSMAFTDNKLASTVNDMNANIAPFAQRGGKLIQYHGWADPVVPSLDSINYYDRVLVTLGVEAWARQLIMATLGSRFGDQDRAFEQDTQVLRKITDFYRLFMVPGMGHCTGGPGPFVFANPMQTALEQWVEQGQAPTSIVATKYVNDTPSAGVSFTRPLCPYPQKAYYLGGQATDAGSFACAVDYRPHSTPIPALEYLR